MALDPEARQVLAALEALGPPPDPDTLTPDELRAATTAAWVKHGPFAPVDRVYERRIPGPAGALRIRVYRPDGAGPFPIVVWFHGGGWVIGNLDENDGACRTLCGRAGAVVMSVEYRLAPEHPFPAAADDAFAALCWAAEHGAEIEGDPRRVAVAGESAGGNLAAVCALRARDTGRVRPVLQVLVSPVVGAPEDGRASYLEYAEDHFLTADTMRFFFRQYVRGGADLTDPYVVPLAAADLSGLAPALVMSAECDVLRDEGEEYARRLQDAGVRCELVRYDGHLHGFFGLMDERLSVAAEAHARAAAALRGAFAAVDPA